MFDIRLNDEQRAYQNLAREFAENEIKPIALELDKKPNWEGRTATNGRLRRSWGTPDTRHGRCG